MHNEEQKRRLENRRREVQEYGVMYSFIYSVISKYVPVQYYILVLLLILYSTYS